MISNLTKHRYEWSRPYTARYSLRVGVSRNINVAASAIISASISSHRQYVTSILQFSNRYIGSTLINTFNTKFSIYHLQKPPIHKHKTQTLCMHNLLNLKSNISTRSSAAVTLQRPHVYSRLKLTDRSFTHYALVCGIVCLQNFDNLSFIHSVHTIAITRVILLLLLLLYIPSRFQYLLQKLISSQSFPP